MGILAKSRRNIIIIVGILCAFMSIGRVEDNNRPGYLMDKSKYETPVYYLDNKDKKVKIFIIAGIHGNEVGGIKAAEEIVQENFNWSSMVVVPMGNIEACRLQVRNPYYMSDLNRAFPGRHNGTDTERLAYEIFELIKREKPDFVIDLHEWNSRFDEDSNLLANGLISNDIGNRLWKSAEKVYSAYNSLGGRDKLILSIGPPKGSINREVSEILDIPVLTIESNMENSLKDRVDFHLYIIENIIKNYEMDDL